MSFLGTARPLPILRPFAVMIDLGFPKTVDEAIERLNAELPLKDRVFVANLKRKDFHLIHLTLGSFIRDALGFSTGNRALIESCRIAAGKPNLTADEAFAVLVEEFWKALRTSHAIRLLKKT